MVVRTQGNAREVTGLHVGTSNARRFFPKSVGTVQFRLGDLQIECKLPASFWDGQPEIHDPRLCEWLRHKVFQQPSRNPMLMAMVQSGDNTFTLQPMSLANRRGHAA